MIDLTFITGGSILKIRIERKVIYMMASQLNFEPVRIDLSKLNEQETQGNLDKMKMSKKDKDEIFELAKRGSEEEIAADIITDFKSKGWRLIKKNVLD